MLATATLRSLKSDSGTSGAADARLDDQEGGEAAPRLAASMPSVCADPQPTVVAVDDGVDREHQGGGHGDGTGDVDLGRTEAAGPPGSSTQRAR